VQAMDGWKRGKPYAIVVCPLYQLPSRTSQIYQQAAVRNVFVASYSRLAILIGLAEQESQDVAQELLLPLFETVETMTPSKDAVAYWTAVNRQLLAEERDGKDSERAARSFASSTISVLVCSSMVHKVQISR